MDSAASREIKIFQTGAPGVLSQETMLLDGPGSHELQIRHTAIGLNYIDVYHRSGLYPVALPFVPGVEGAGIVEACGKRVSGFCPGDRIVYALSPGSYSDRRVLDHKHAVKIPDGISDRVAAAGFLKGLTARFLLKKSFPVKPGDTILVLAAAGGVGQLLCQWARHLGVIVIGCVGSEEKVEIAKKNGCHHVVQYTKESIVDKVLEWTDGRGVQVSYDSVGKDTLNDSLKSLAPEGTLISYGNASGPVENLNLAQLSANGSLYIQRPTLGTYIRTRDMLESAAQDLFSMILQGLLKIEVGKTFPLEQAAKAHQYLESKRSQGPTLLIP